MRVILGEDNFLLREGTRQLLETAGELQVVAAVGAADELLKAVDELTPDAVITDIRMPPRHQMEGIEAAHAIRETHPSIGVVVLSQYAHDAYALKLFANGTAGYAYLLKERVSDVEELVRAVKETVAGRTVIDPAIVDAMVGRRTRAGGTSLAELNRRELEVLSLMAQGLSNPVIGERLFLSESGVSKHISSIFLKLGLTEETQSHRRVAAVLAYLKDSAG